MEKPVKKSKNATKKKTSQEPRLKNRVTTVPKKSSTSFNSTSMTVSKTSSKATGSVKKTSGVTSQSPGKLTKTVKNQASSVKTVVKPISVAQKPSLSQVQRNYVPSKHSVERVPLSSDELRSILLERRSGILKNFDSEIVTSREISSPPVSGDAADIAQDASENELTIQLAEVESRELFQINMALDKINNGTFGLCEICGENISSARLKALPFAAKCIRCQEEEERRY